MDLKIARLSQAPRLADRLWSLSTDWPAFMLEDPAADFYYPDVEAALPDYVLLAWDNDDPERLLARAFSVPFAFGPDVRRPALPAAGWDAVVRWGWFDRVRSRTPTHVSALEITVAGHARGTGLSARVLEALRENTRQLGFSDLFAPVRPNGKSAVPRTPIASYVRQARADGLPVDPWLRVHVRAGGQVVSIAPTSMTVPGTLEQWRDWTGLPFETSGDIEVPGALSPVHCRPADDHAVYVEPNVWVHHRL